MHTEDPRRKQGIELLCIMQQLCVCPSTIVLQVSFRLKAIGDHHYMHSVIILVVSYGEDDIIILVVSYGEDDKVSHLISIWAHNQGSGLNSINVKSKYLCTY